MNVHSYTRLNSNYFTKIGLVKVYVDYVNSSLKIVNFNSISTQTLRRIIYFASKQHLGKVICNCGIEYFENFVMAGFTLEGKIDSYFKGKDAFCMSYFISKNRKLSKSCAKEEFYLKQCSEKNDTFLFDGHSKYCIRDAKESDIKGIIELFYNVFSMYPSPMYDEECIKQTMKEKILYKVALDKDRIISVASADMDSNNLNAEITNCATYPQYRGKGILSNIIYSLESELKKREFITLYSISRATNPGINYAFSKNGYKYRGRLINNCNICGAFEDMNIWTKRIK